MNKNLILEEQNPFQKLLNWKGWLKKTPQNSKVNPVALVKKDFDLLKKLFIGLEKDLGDDLIKSITSNVMKVNGKFTMVSRLGNVLEIEKVIKLSKGVKEGKLPLDKFIKILPEKFPDGELCASRFRKALTGLEAKVPKLEVTKGIKFSPKEQTKIVRNLIEIEKHWNKSTWTNLERQRGYKEFVDEMEIQILPNEFTTKRVSAKEYYDNGLELLQKELDLGNITQKEFDEIKAGFGEIDWKNWAWDIRKEKLPNNVKYAKRKVKFRIWDKKEYLQANNIEEYAAQGNCETGLDHSGQTESIVNIFPENYQGKPNRETVKNLIYHEISHAKDAGLGNKSQVKGYRKDYRPSPDVDLTQVDKKYYTTFSKEGKPTKKEWDFYKNYFVHPIENKVIFRATLEDIKTNINKWLKSRIKEYNEVGYDDIKSKKAAMKDTIGWLRDVQGFLKSI